MKLHLPKQLFTALLAAITLATAPTALTLGSAAWGAAAFTTSDDGTTATYSGQANQMQFSNIGGDVEKLILNTSGGWLDNTTLNADVLVQIGADGNVGTTGLVLSDGGGSTYTIANKVIGSGLIKKTGNGTNMVLEFTGDVSEYTGNMELGANAAFNLRFGNAGVSAVSSEANGASGTGTITFTSSNNTLKYAYAPSETPVYITNVITTSGSGQAKMEISNGADYIFTKDVTVNALTAGADSTLTFNGALTLNGTVAVQESITANGAVTLGAGVVFDLSKLERVDGVYTLFSGSTTVDLSGVTLSGKKENWTYTAQNNGTVLATFLGKTVTGNGDNDSATTFEWGEGTTFAEGGAFALYDNVNITGSDAIKLTSAISANQVTIGAANDSDITVSFTEDSNVLKVQDGFVIRDGATVEVNKSTGEAGFIQGEVTIENGGVLKFNQKDVTGYNGGAASMHTINVQAGGELQLNITGNETFAGTLNLDGTVKGVHTGGSARFDMYGGKATIKVGANKAASMENINLQLRQNDSVITVGNNATLSLSGTITKNEDNGVLYKYGAGSMVVGGNVDITTLNLGAGTMDLQGGASITNVNIANGTTLTLGKEGAANDTTYTITNLTGAATGSVLKLESNATLNKLNSVTSSVTLTGSGTYHYGTWNNANKFTPGFTLDSNNWTGTVALTGGDRGKPLDNLAAASTDISKLKLTGFKGYLDGTRKMSNNLILDNDNIREDAGYGYGILLDNGGTSDTANVTFSGSVEGDGHIIYGWKNTNDESKKSITATHIFSGDTSEWNGMFIRDLRFTGTTGNTYGKNVFVKFTAGGDVFKENGNGGVMDGEKSGQLNVVIDAAGSDGVKPDTNFHGAITDVNSVTVSSNTDFKKAVTTASLTVAASTNASFDSTLDADTVTLNASSTLTLGGGGTAETPVTHSIGTLSAASAGVTLGDYATLTLGGGTAEARKQHSVGTLSMGAGASVSLGENATLQLVNTLPSSHGKYNNGNSDQEASLDLTIQGAAGSMLSLALNTVTSWNTNDTIKLRPLTADGGTVESVYIREGALANAVYNDGAVTDLGGANLTMAGNTQLVLRKVLAENTNFGAGTITLEGTTGMALYGDNAYTISNRIEGANGILNITGDNASSSITFTNVLQLATLTSNRNVTLGGGTEASPVIHSVGTLSAASAEVALGDYATLNLGGGTHSIGTLSGSGVVSVNSGESAAATLSINKLAGYTGSLNAVGSGANTGTITALTGGEVRLTGITLDNATATITTNNNSYTTQSLGNVTLSNGATLGISDTADLNGYQTINISKLDVHGSGNLKTTTAADGWQAQFIISTLTGDTGVDGTLRFSTNSKTTNKTVFNLNGAGDVLFSGNISVGVDNNGDSRKAALNINNASVAQQAIITLESPINSTKPGSVMLGVGMDGATVRGIKDGENPSGGYSGGNRYIDSGQYKVDSENLINDEVNRTLVIATQNGDDFSSSATIGNYVSLQKDNNGSQTFNGDLSNFNGSIKVTGGTLALESSQAMNNAGNVTVTGGTLHVSNDISTTKLAVANEGIAKFDSTLTADTVQLGETATITGKQDSAATMSKVQMNSTGISGAATDGTKGSISDANVQIAQLAADASFTIADMTLTNTSIVADSGVKVKLENVSATNSMLTGGGQFALNATSTVGTAAAGETRGTLSYSAGLGVAEGSTLTLNLDVLNAVGGDQHGVYDLTITLSGFGADFAVTEAVLGMVKFDENSWLGQALEGAMFSVVTESAPEAAAAAAGGAPSVSYAAGSNVGTLVITINGLNVPEPTTATLSLLALAALAARRRRK